MSRDPRDEEHGLAVLKGAVENTNEAFVTIDSRHRVVFFNKAAERIFGYSREEVLGRDLDTIMSPSCSSSHHAAVDRYLRSRVPTRIGHGTEITAVRKSGETFPANISFSESRMEGEIFFTGVVRDLTETSELRELLKRSERLAAMGQLVAEITHEIRNPLMVIGGFARQLIRDLEDGRNQQKLAIMVDEIVRLETLLNDLRDMYLPRKLRFTKVDVAQMVRDLADLVRSECESRGVRLALEIRDEPLVLRGDEDRLKEVLLNLIRNSIDAMEGRGTLGIAARGLEEQVEISVTDDGCGIPPAHQAQIFTPFFTTKSRGTGLGLSICKRIIEEHSGGTLTFESAPGKGTTFRVTMPVSRADRDEGGRT